MFGRLCTLLLSCSTVLVCGNLNNLRDQDSLDSIDGIDRGDHKLHTHVFKEHLPGLSSRTDIIKQGRVHKDLTIRLYLR